MSGVLDWFRGGSQARVDQLETALDQERETAVLLAESVGDLELALDDAGWQRLAITGETEFSRDGMNRLAGLCRLMAIKNPLIKRGLNLRAYYVWGLGVNIAARETGPSHDNGAAQDVNQVVQDFLDDESNRVALTGTQAQEENERALGTDGNLFLALFTTPLGKVRVRTLPFEEIADVITNPQDKSEPWLYLRRWTTRSVNMVTLSPVTATTAEYYPALGYKPKRKMPVIGDLKVNWDAPVLHVRVNGQRGWTYGIPDAYAALDWARAYKEFLEDWAKLVKALSRFAWRATSTGNAARRKAIAAKLAEAPSVNQLTGDPNDIGGTAVTNAGTNLEAIPKSGATIDSESGRPIAAMVAAGLDVSVVSLLADPGVTGARATAETLDRPTELMAGTRRAVWAEAYRRILDYVVDEAVRAKVLKGAISVDRLTGEETIELAGKTERTVDIEFPDLDEIDPLDMMKALQIADQLNKIPPLVIARLVCQVLGLEDIDEILDELTDKNGEFVDPGASAGQVAADAFRNGQDPVGAVTGQPPAPPPADAGATA